VYIKQEEEKKENLVPGRNAFSCSTMNNQRREIGVLAGDEHTTGVHSLLANTVFSYPWIKTSNLLQDQLRK
jgi:hypothetical protein